MRNSRHAAAALAGVTVATMLLTAGCGSGTDSGSGEYGAAEDVSAAQDDYGGNGYGSDYGDEDTGSDAEAQLGEPAGELAVAADAELGDVVTDSEGFTLYRFEEDSAQPPESTCVDDCATAWPPVPADDAEVSADIDPELLGEVEREDGTTQLTLAGWPVYRYAEDTEPGTTNGHGVNGTWNALAPNGAPAGTAAAEEGDVGLAVVEDPELGRILADAEGRTLYRFDGDTAWPMSTGCTGDCLDVWKPAAVVDPDDVQQGVALELVNSFERPDGTEQLAIDCWILYWYTGDEEPGDTTGHGVNGTWWATAPDGTKATAE